MSKMKELITSAMEYSTFHAIPNIARTQRNGIKVMWILILIISSGICGFLVVKTVFQFMAFEVHNKFNVIYETPTKFPTVTICNLNPYVTDEAFEFFGELMAASNITETNQELLNISIKSPILKKFYNFKAAQFLTLTYTLRSNVSNERIKKFGLPLEKFVLMCIFKSVECNYQEFSWFFDPIYGNCWKFNSGKDIGGKTIDLKSTSQPGISEGLMLLLNTGVPDNWLSFSYKTGARIFISNNTVDATTYDAIEIATGFQTNFQVQRQFIHKLPKPYNDCYDDLVREEDYDSELYRAIIRYNKTYRRVECYRLCLQKLITQRCNCCNIYDLSLYGMKPCSELHELVCVTGAYTDFYSSDITARCGDLCPLECDSVLYSFSSSFSSIPTNNFLKFLNRSAMIRDMFPGQEITSSLIKENFAMVCIYYDENKYFQITEVESMNAVDMISNIGGTLGVFLGISFLSFIEMIELAIEVLAIFLQKPKTKPNTKQVGTYPRIATSQSTMKVTKTNENRRSESTNK